MTDQPMQAQAPPAAPQRPVPKKPVDPQVVDKITKDVNTVGANLRILEERFSLMRSKGTTSEQGIIELERGLNKDLKSLNDQVNELKHELKDIFDKLRLIDSEMKNLTKKEDFKVVEKYLELWQPLEFITRNELEKLLEEKKLQEEKEGKMKNQDFFKST